MIKKANKVLVHLKQQLELVETEVESVLEKSEAGIKLSKEALKELRNIIILQDFNTIQDEIYFFKVVKPEIYSKLIYYVKLFSIESKRPRSSNKSQIKYLNSHIDKLQLYLNENLEFYHYFRRGSTFLDQQYFRRGKEDIRLHPDSFHFFSDEEFSTSHDSTVAKIMAYDMLIVYLKTEIEKLENTNTMETALTNNTRFKLFWTANKTDLIELIYALHSSGSINSGTADIKEMATACEQLFNIDLGDFYRTFLEIRSRKINQTKFIDKLRDALLQKMEELDE